MRQYLHQRLASVVMTSWKMKQLCQLGVCLRLSALDPNLGIYSTHAGSPNKGTNIPQLCLPCCQACSSVGDTSSDTLPLSVLCFPVAPSSPSLLLPLVCPPHMHSLNREICNLNSPLQPMQFCWIQWNKQSPSLLLFDHPFQKGNSIDFGSTSYSLSVEKVSQ